MLFQLIYKCISNYGLNKKKKTIIAPYLYFGRQFNQSISYDLIFDINDIFKSRKPLKKLVLQICPGLTIYRLTRLHLYNAIMTSELYKF